MKARILTARPPGNSLDKFLERYKSPKLTQEETDNQNSLISVKEIESEVKNDLAGWDGEGAQMDRTEEDEGCPSLSFLGFDDGLLPPRVSVCAPAFDSEVPSPWKAIPDPHQTPVS